MDDSSIIKHQKWDHFGWTRHKRMLVLTRMILHLQPETMSDEEYSEFFSQVRSKTDIVHPMRDDNEREDLAFARVLYRISEERY